MFVCVCYFCIIDKFQVHIFFLFIANRLTQNGIKKRKNKTLSIFSGGMEVEFPP